MPSLPRRAALLPPLCCWSLLLACSDGLWGALDDEAIARPWTKPGETLSDALGALAKRAVAAAGPGADNTTGVVLRWLGQS